MKDMTIEEAVNQLLKIADRVTTPKTISKRDVQAIDLIIAELERLSGKNYGN